MREAWELEDVVAAWTLVEDAGGWWQTRVGPIGSGSRYCSSSLSRRHACQALLRKIPAAAVTTSPTRSVNRPGFAGGSIS